MFAYLCVKLAAQLEFFVIVCFIIVVEQRSVYKCTDFDYVLFNNMNTSLILVQIAGIALYIYITETKSLALIYTLKCNFVSFLKLEK